MTLTEYNPLSEIDSGDPADILNNVMPLPASQMFTGREDYLEKLRNYFSPTDNSQHQKQFLLHGMGGVGKTQICLKFVEESADK